MARKKVEVEDNEPSRRVAKVFIPVEQVVRSLAGESVTDTSQTAAKSDAGITKVTKECGYIPNTADNDIFFVRVCYGENGRRQVEGRGDGWISFLGAK